MQELTLCGNVLIAVRFQQPCMRGYTKKLSSAAIASLTLRSSCELQDDAKIVGMRIESSHTHTIDE